MFVIYILLVLVGLVMLIKPGVICQLLRAGNPMMLWSRPKCMCGPFVLAGYYVRLLGWWWDFCANVGIN